MLSELSRIYDVFSRFCYPEISDVLNVSAIQSNPDINFDCFGKLKTDFHLAQIDLQRYFSY